MNWRLRMADPKVAFSITIDQAHEGGYQCDPNDRGNWTSGVVGQGELKGTKYGISAHEFPNEDIKNLTPERAIEIYTEGYWKTGYSQIVSQAIANKLADLGVLFGVHEAVAMLQAALKIVPDGGFGPNTLAAVNASEPKSLLVAYQTLFVQHVLKIGADNPDERKYVSDWIRRINS